MELYTVKEVSEQTGALERRVRRWAARLNLGTLIHARLRVFTREEVDILKRVLLTQTDPRIKTVWGRRDGKEISRRSP